MSRNYTIQDASGNRHISEMELPLRVGGKDHAGIVIPAVEDDDLFAVIALSDGHAYIQPAGDSDNLFHNDERLMKSEWLKSGDRVQIGESVVSWEVQGDKVQINVSQLSESSLPHPPLQPPNGNRMDGDRLPNDEMPVHAETPEQGDGKKGRRYFFLFISVLLITAIFLLTATSVVIKLEPQSASLNMKGFPPPLSMWGSFLVLPGRYTVEASVQGYAPLKKDVYIAMGGTTNLSYVLTELPGLLTIKPVPGVALQLYIDNVETDLGTDGRVEIARGHHLLHIETERYLVYQAEIEIQGYGKPQQLDISLVPAWASVSITSQPEGARVSIDDEDVGITPLLTDVLQGRHEVLLEKETYKPMVIMQSVTAGEDINLQDIKLQPADGRLSISSVPDGASVMAGGVYQGTTPVTINLTANTEQKLRLSKAGYSTIEQSIQLEPEQEHAIQVKLVAEYATVFLTIRPAGAKVMLDGKKIDASSKRLRLKTRPHSLVVSKKSYVTQHVTVTPQHGISQNVAVSLKSDQQLAAQKKTSETPGEIKTAAGQQLKLVKPETNFTMGASRREAGRRANENQRLVQLQRAFYFATKEVTNGEFRRFRASHDSGKFDGAALNGDAQPVVNISWDDAARYSNWLSKQHGLPMAYIEKTGKMVAANPMTTGYRLPSEAEWAWIARKQGSEKLRRYPWQGSYPPKGKNGNYADANIADTLADVLPLYDDGFRGTAPVASFPASPAGFYDMGGNVAEWMNDYYAVYPGEAKRLVKDPLGPQSGEHHVVRGSSWRHGNITELRLSFRDYSSKPRYDLGFRIARYAE